MASELYRGYVINRAADSARWAEMSARLAAVGATVGYERFDAVEGTVAAKNMSPGELECWFNHKGIQERQ